MTRHNESYWKGYHKGYEQANIDMKKRKKTKTFSIRVNSDENIESINKKIIEIQNRIKEFQKGGN